MHLSQHRTARIAALTLTGALTLGACAGSADEDVKPTGSSAEAATIDGERITVGEVQTSTRELTKALAAQAKGSGQKPQAIAPADLLPSLVQVPAILDFAKSEDVPIPAEATVRKQLSKALPDPSATTVEFFQANAVISQMDEKQKQEVGKIVQQQKVTFGPRFAALSGKPPNWLKPAAPAQDTPPMP